METFKYETHLHTLEGSACGRTSGPDYIEPFYNAGYSGIFVTDHFFGGNTAAPKASEAYWEMRVSIYCRGYEKAFEEAQAFNKKHGLIGTPKEFKVFFGIEQTFQGDDYLVYGFDKDWLLAHPEVEHMNQKELLEAVNKVQGLMIQAHPFRLRDYIQAIHLHCRDVHGVEVYNAGNQSKENALAELYAKDYDFPVTSGSDIHNVALLQPTPGKLPVGGMIFDSPLEDVFDYARRVKAKQYKLIKYEKEL